MNLSSSNRQWDVGSKAETKYWEESGITIVTVKISAEFDQEQLGGMFTEDLAGRVFAMLDEDPQGNLPLSDDTDPHDPVWRCTKMVPQYRFAMHQVTVGDYGTYGVQPEWKDIKPVAGQRLVKATLVLPIALEDVRAEAGALAVALGTKQKIKFTTQKPLPGTTTAVRTGKGAHGNNQPTAIQ